MTIADFNNSLIVNSEFLMPFAFTLTQDKEDAKDLYQETLARALANKDKYNFGTNIKAWLYTIMRNIFINNYRKKSRHKIVVDDEFYVNSSKATTTNDAIAAINIKDIQREIIELPEDFKHPFVLYFDGFKYTEIAGMLNEPLGTIKSRIHFARKLLRSQLERF
jgi:RNA polymerase sigma factor (sigma-70 family)